MRSFYFIDIKWINILDIKLAQIQIAVLSTYRNVSKDLSNVWIL